MTLAESVGQLAFGHLADRFGRTKLYGVEVPIVTLSTIAISVSSTGAEGSMSSNGNSSREYKILFDKSITPLMSLS
jgi:MFS family permease